MKVFTSDKFYQEGGKDAKFKGGGMGNLGKKTESSQIPSQNNFIYQILFKSDKMIDLEMGVKNVQFHMGIKGFETVNN